jgi:hypothetical protein
MLVGYFKLAMLPDDAKAQNKIKVGAIVPRLDCIRYSGNYNGLEAFKSPKSQLFFNLTPCREIIETHTKRYAEFCLCANSLNFGSLYKYLDFPNYAFSYPNAHPTIGKERKPNPLYTFRNDLYLMILSADYTKIEIFVVEDGRNFAETQLQTLIDGGFDAEIDYMRNNSQTFYNYIGYDNNCQ